MVSAVDLLDDRVDDDLDELAELLAIDSVSTDPKRAERVADAAEWTRDRLAEAGFEADIVETEGHPAVVGRRIVDPDRPTLLWYGHVDVQPEDPLDEWTSPPFEATVDGDKLVARGAVDDKGQVHAHLSALRALEETGEPTANVVALIEGEEEIGSPHLEPVLADHVDADAIDAVVISDTGMVQKGQPTITTGLRGLAYFEVTFRSTGSDLHSGVYGGAVRNPANALAAVVGSLHDEEGRVAIPGFYDDVEPLSQAERESLAELPFDEEAYREMLGARELWGEQGYSVLERVGGRPTLDVNGLTAGYQGEGAKTVIPATASAKLSMRLVPDQDPDRIERLFEETIRERAPDEVDATVEPMHHAAPWRTDPSGPFVQAARDAAEEAWGVEPVFMREGGTIPILAIFEQHLDGPIVLLGLGLPDGNIHAPDENLDLDNYRIGRRAIARFYQLAGEVGR